MINFQNSFNARNSSPDEIAKKFVYTDSFDKLKNPYHSIIFGARGCGKTTLMKMLTLPALHNWKDDRAFEFREKINFYAIYVPNDITWELKNESLKKTRISVENVNTLINVTFNINVFIALLNTFIDIFDYENLEKNDDKEIRFCFFLINSLKLSSRTFPDFISIKQELYKINTDINFFVNKHINNFDIDSLRREIPFIDIDFHSTSLLILEKFSSTDFYNIGKKWAFCFDELEFAPSIIKTQLYKLLRSTDQRLLYKISSSPLVSDDVKDVLNKNYSPSSGNDFESIKVWESQNNAKFQKDLIENILKEHGITKSLSEYFGSNERYLNRNNKDDEDYLGELRELYKKDNSFRDFLDNKSINLDIQDSLKSNDTLLRKIKPVVYFRNYLISENRDKTVKLAQHKKNIRLYSGFELLIDITDGNPRWLIGLINSIIQKCGTEKADPSKQYDEILKVANRFRNFINSIPIYTNKYNFNDLIESIGVNFFNILVDPSFTEEPETTFKVDSDDRDLRELIEKGLFQGAFVFAEEINDCESDLINKRLKLSYLFHPIFKLLIRKNKPRNLSNILGKERVEKNSRSKKNHKVVFTSQPTLFDNEN